ncbi:DUF2977 domain-containing protein [Pediococcus pentosaceus]|uniref:DUF2977 domain-containing protein n=1 Tax=Pediococcus pentosaceus TaxID=1255 RepID=UPI002FF13CD9
MKIQLELSDKNEIIQYATIGGLTGATDYEIKSIPENFDYKFKPSFYMLQNDEIVENPNYVAPEPPVIEPSKQDKINAQIMLDQAKQKADQDKFNAQILLKLAGGMK